MSIDAVGFTAKKKKGSRCVSLVVRALIVNFVIFGVSSLMMGPSSAQSQNTAEQQETPKLQVSGSFALCSRKLRWYQSVEIK